MGKIATAIATCRAVSAKSNGAILVALSGGKDSLATLDLCAQTFDRVEAMFWYFVDGLECVETHLFAVAKRYGVKVHKVPRSDVAGALSVGAYMPQWDGVHAKSPRLKQTDIETACKRKAGLEWLAYGIRANDSIQRMAMLKATTAIDTTSKRIYPIADWTTAEVYAYLRAKKIPLPTKLGNRRMSDVGLNGPILSQVKRDFPRDYAKILEVFPYAEALVFRHEQMRNGK